MRGEQFRNRAIKLRVVTRTRASKIVAAVIILNVLIGGFAAGVVLSPEYYALDQAIKKGASLPPPPPDVVKAVLAERLWFVNGDLVDAWDETAWHVQTAWLMRPNCSRLCRVRRVIVIAVRSRFESDDAMLRAYIATKPPLP